MQASNFWQLAMCGTVHGIRQKIKRQKVKRQNSKDRKSNGRKSNKQKNNRQKIERQKLLLLLFYILKASQTRWKWSNVIYTYIQKGSSNKWKTHKTHYNKNKQTKDKKTTLKSGGLMNSVTTFIHQRTLKTSVNQR